MVTDKLRKKAEYLQRVTRGEGFMPWQNQERRSARERAFRARMEKRKDEMLDRRVSVKHPVMLAAKDVQRAKRNVEATGWARKWVEEQKRIADYIISRPDEYVEKMISELTPGNLYCQICPHCAGRLSQESGPPAGGAFGWDYRHPDTITCNICGQVYPNARYAETVKLVCPRTGQTFTYYVNEKEKQHPRDCSGKYAYHWFGHPVHVSFSGLIRYFRARFMMLEGLPSLAVVYRMTEDPRYAQKAVQILNRLAVCYRQWLYHDYWDAIADCDPMYAAWHDHDLPLEWKRHLSAEAFREDSEERAAMLQSYWGAGRFHSSIDMSDGQLVSVCQSYDLVRDARDETGQPLWDAGTRARVERDLIIEAMLTAEPFLGGRGHIDNVSNLAVNTYDAMASVARCLGIAEWADTALRAYEKVRDSRMHFDGFCREAPLYNNRYLYGLAMIAEALDGFRWPHGFPDRSGKIDLYRTDPFLRLLFRAALDQLQPDGSLLPLSDTFPECGLWRPVPEIGLRRFPEYYKGVLPMLWSPKFGGMPQDYALFHLDAAQAAQQDHRPLPEILFPGWMTAVLRHGTDRKGSVLALAFNSPGAHRHRDNLTIYYADSGQPILGDLGYVETVNQWLTSTFSHNLVIVDGQEQIERVPSLRMMATSPEVSVVEASSKVYPQCSEYRRLVALMKGPDAQTFAIDIFRVKGGKRHDYRLFSELASSDAGEAGLLETMGIDLPREEPLPKVGGSMKHEDIFGLRDTRTVKDPPENWKAVWKEKGRSYRLWMLAQADVVQASNGPGQEKWNKAGRRVRYLDVIHNGPEVEQSTLQGKRSDRNIISSTFVAVHEPSGPRGSMPIRKATRLDVPDEAGPNAVALRIESKWGTYHIFSEFVRQAEVDGIRFQGTFGVICVPTEEEQWFFALGASTLKQKAFGFSRKAAVWAGKARSNTDTVIATDTQRPADWPALPRNCTNYVLVQGGEYQTGFPLDKVGRNHITVRRFPLQKVTEFYLPALRFIPG